MNHSADIGSLFGVSIAAPSSGAAYRNYSLAAGVVVGPMAADGKRYHSFNSVSAVQDLFGSNSTAAKLATSWFGGGFGAIKPKQFGIITIDANNVKDIAAGKLTYNETGNYFVYGGEPEDAAFAFIKEQSVAGNPVYVSVTTGNGVMTFYAKVTDVPGKQIQFFNSKADFGANKPVVFSEAPYSLESNDATYSAVVYEDALADALGEILASPEYYWLVIDPAFSQEQCLMIQAAIATKKQGSGYFAAFLDTDTKCWSENATDDTTTLMAKTFNAKRRTSAVVYADTANNNEMQHAAFLSFFGTMSDSTEIGTIDVKAVEGITANKTSPSYSYDDQPGQDNIGSNPNNPVGKNGNVYSNYTNFGTCFRYGTAASGDEIGRVVLEDWLVNRILVNLWNWRINAKSARYTRNTQDALIRNISAPLALRVQTGDIVTGVSADGEHNLPKGYTVSVPMASASDRQQRIWTGLSFAYLYGNSAKYFEITGIGTI
jgi:hypothetical protein